MKRNINIAALVLNTFYLLYLISGQILLFYRFKNISAIGIIGGADGPTAVYTSFSTIGFITLFIIVFFEIVFILNISGKIEK